MTRERAEQLAHRIREHWKAQGYDVRVEVIREPWVEKVNTGGHSVRTDLKNGLPKNYKKEKKHGR